MTGLEAGEVTVVAFQEGNNDYLPTTVKMYTFLVLDNSHPTQVTSLTTEEQDKAEKIYHNGILYLHYQGRLYDAQGRKMK